MPRILRVAASGVMLAALGTACGLVDVSHPVTTTVLPTPTYEVPPPEAARPGRTTVPLPGVAGPAGIPGGATPGDGTPGDGTSGGNGTPGGGTSGDQIVVPQYNPLTGQLIDPATGRPIELQSPPTTSEVAGPARTTVPPGPPPTAPPIVYLPAPNTPFCVATAKVLSIGQAFWNQFKTADSATREFLLTSMFQAFEQLYPVAPEPLKSVLGTELTKAPFYLAALRSGSGSAYADALLQGNSVVGSVLAPVLAKSTVDCARPGRAELDGIPNLIIPNPLLIRENFGLG